jgi:hypothetical protein
MPIAQQGPMTRAQARRINYQVKSFLAVQTSSSPNGVLLKPCDDFLMLKNLGDEPAGHKSNQGNHQVDAGVNKKMIGPNVQTARSDLQASPF